MRAAVGQEDIAITEKLLSIDLVAVSFVLLVGQKQRLRISR